MYFKSTNYYYYLNNMIDDQYASVDTIIPVEKCEKGRFLNSKA